MNIKKLTSLADEIEQEAIQHGVEQVLYGTNPVPKGINLAADAEKEYEEGYVTS